jgi:murein DD-endopeptidase MepM/ murein hydrolase activator NlpD
MLPFLRDLFSRTGAAARTVILLEPDAMTAPRQYEVQPRKLLRAAIAAGLGVGLLLLLIVLLTPLRRLALGPGTAELRALARANASRAEALEDSLAVQHHQLAQLRALFTGDLDSTAAEPLPENPSLPESEAAAAELGVAPILEESAAPQAAVQPRPGADRSDTLRWLPLATPAPGTPAALYLAGLRLPALPPLAGVLSRGFDAAAGHFGLDIVARAGSPVRAVGDGYVVAADWTHTGGYTIAVQHPNGYLSIYAHNQRLLKRIGDRVRSREALALSGNTGAVTTGPHLHFELWRDGLAQDPRAFLLLPAP